MQNTILHNYQALINIDAMLNNHLPQYPFTLNEQATFTQHQITLYQSNYCHKDSKETSEQPSILGGAHTSIVFVEL